MLYTLNSYEQHPPYTASAFLIQHFVERTTKSTISCGATMAGDIKFARTTLTNFVKPSQRIYLSIVYFIMGKIIFLSYGLHGRVNYYTMLVIKL